MLSTSPYSFCLASPIEWQAGWMWINGSYLNFIIADCRMWWILKSFHTTHQTNFSKYIWIYRGRCWMSMSMEGLADVTCFWHLSFYVVLIAERERAGFFLFELARARSIFLWTRSLELVRASSTRTARFFWDEHVLRVDTLNALRVCLLNTLPCLMIHIYSIGQICGEYIEYILFNYQKNYCE